MYTNYMAAELIPYNKEQDIVIYRTEDGTVQLDVQLSDETVWLTQKQMAWLFDTTPQNVTMHIGNVYKEGELSKSSTCKDFLQVQIEGGIEKRRKAKFYNLDVIISVGYRVKSQRGTQFRQWANKIIKQYLLRGYSINERLIAIEDRIDRRLLQHEQILADHQEKIDFFVRTSLPPVEQVFFGGEFFEARVILESIIKTAQKRVIIIDAYVDAATFEMLDVRAEGVTAQIFSGKDLTELRNLHNAKPNTAPIDTFVWTNPSHDRWLIVDDTVYHCSHSLKDMGRKMSAISQMGINAEKILNEIR